MTEQASASAVDVSGMTSIPDRVIQLGKTQTKFFSFEYYPPKSDKGVTDLKDRIMTMRKWGPQWMDVTWGAGGSTSELTQSIAEFIQKDAQMQCLMHLTCTNMDTQKIDDALVNCQKVGISNILALRGDPPKGQSEWKAIDGGMSNARDLITYIESTHPGQFNIVCAGYPEGHPTIRKVIPDYKTLEEQGKVIDMATQSTTPDGGQPDVSADSDDGVTRYWAVRQGWDDEKKVTYFEGALYDDFVKEVGYLKSKIDAGARMIITQLFYDVGIFKNWIGECRRMGIDAPIMPGIMPIRNYGVFNRMTKFCKTVIPKALGEALLAVKTDADACIEIGKVWMNDLCDDLMSNGHVPGVHIYAMNTTYTPALILSHLGMGNQEEIEKEEEIVKRKEKRLKEKGDLGVLVKGEKREMDKEAVVPMQSF